MFLWRVLGRYGIDIKVKLKSSYPVSAPSSSVLAQVRGVRVNGNDVKLDIAGICYP